MPGSTDKPFVRVLSPAAPWRTIEAGRFALMLFFLAVFGGRLVLAALLPMSDTTEPRYAETSRLMLEKNDWVTPWYTAQTPFWGKPPLSFWAQALTMKALGISDFAARLPSFLAVIALALMTAQLGRALGGATLARNAGLVFATMALVLVCAGAVMTDAFLALGTTLALMSAILLAHTGERRWRWRFFLGIAIGLLAKGPLVLVLVGLPMITWSFWSGIWRPLWGSLPWWRGTALTLLLVSPWYALAERATPGFLHYFLFGEHVLRFIEPGWSGDLYGRPHDRPRGTIWLYLLAASAPWGLLGLTTLGQRLARARRSADNGRQLVPGERFLLLAAFTPALFFTLAGNVLWAYVLPGLPFLALLLAKILEQSVWLTRYRWLAASCLPLALFGAGALLAAKPHLLPSQYALLNYYEQTVGAGYRNLYYLNSTPHSARYYSHDTVRTLSFDELQTLPQDRPSYLVVRDRDLGHLGAEVDYTAAIIYSTKRYHLLRLPL